MRWAAPYWLLLLTLVPLCGWLALRRARGLTLVHPRLTRMVTEGLHPGRWTRFRHLPLILRLAAAALLILALARPQSGVSVQPISTQGVDVLVALDISGSMAYEDFKPNRIHVAKEVVAEFVAGRPRDRVGLVLFAAEAFTQVPLTLDHRMLQDALGRVQLGLITDGTAIGSALATAVARLKDSEADSRVVVLLTDGENNRGEIDPVTAAQMAKGLGIRVYTVAVGRDGRFVQMRQSPLFGKVPVTVESRVDEELLKQMAEVTGGQFFRARDEDALKDIYARIDALERSPFSGELYLEYRDHYPPLLAVAVVLLLLEWMLAATRLKRLPG